MDHDDVKQVANGIGDTRRTCSGVLKRTNPRHVTAASRTSSLTSETATCNNRRIALLFEVPQYAIPMAYMAPYRKIGSRSRASCSIVPSAASSWLGEVTSKEVYAARQGVARYTRFRNQF